MNEYLHIRIDSQLKKQFEALAESLGVSKSLLTRRLILMAVNAEI